MRIALITDGIWPYVLGGMQKHSYYLCKYLAQQKVQVDLFHFNNSSYDLSKLEFFSEQERSFITSYEIDIPKSIALPGHYIRNSYKHSRIIYDVIKGKLPLYNFIYTKGFTGWYLMKQKSRGKISCCPIAVKFHGYEMFQTPPDSKVKLQHVFLLRKPVQNISLMADFVFSYGGKITEIIRSLGVPERKIIEIPSGVEQSSISTYVRPTENRIKFLYLGRYERRKGIEELNKTLKEFIKSGFIDSISFNFIGPIPINKQIDNKNIMYHGEFRDRIELQKLIQQNDVLVCPSWSEGMPNVILEAMANGLAVVATDVGATNVLVDSSTGWLIQNSKPKVLAEVLKEVALTEISVINQKKQNALKLITEKFTWEKLINKLMNKLREVS